ncbi:MAG TPA: lectin-like protein [Candidatus Baltobacteraceae bacterium]|nr:lectin-like protein [Candidatus Baltobacteraceae bacterium]
MKTITLSCVAALFLGATFHSNAKIISGPIMNPANGHEYYLLDQNNWAASEAEAEKMGGTLAIIRNAAEQEWVFSKFSSADGVNRGLWIGLHKDYSGAPFKWVDGEPVDYVHWGSGQPDNAGNVENSAHMWPSSMFPNGVWNDEGNDGIMWGVVEVPGKSNPKSLSDKERSLIGIWYVSGNAEQPSHITATENQLFGINNFASRIILTPDGQLFASNWRVFGEVSSDKILWSNGTWWSRKPAMFETAEKRDVIKD